MVVIQHFVSFLGIFFPETYPVTILVHRMGQQLVTHKSLTTSLLIITQRLFYRLLPIGQKINNNKSVWIIHSHQQVSVLRGNHLGFCIFFFSNCFIHFQLVEVNIVNFLVYVAKYFQRHFFNLNLREKFITTYGLPPINY